MEFEVPGVHGVDDGGVHAEDFQALEHVVLAQSQASCFLVHVLKLLRVVVSELPHRLQPDVQQAESGVAQCGVDTTAAGVAADEDVLDLEMCDCELDDGERVDVGCGDNVGDVAVHEDLAGLQTEDGRLRDARVGAADPENGGRLAGGGASEEVWLGFRGQRAPF